MSKNDENEVIDFDELMLNNSDLAKNAGIEFSKKIEEYENRVSKTHVTDDSYSPYFTSIPYRKLIGRYDTQINSFIAFVSLVSGIENDIVKTVLWDVNPYMRKNINPGDKLIHMSPNHITHFFTELIKFKA